MGNNSSDKVNVFISHKHEDEHAARSIKKILERYSASRLNCFISEEIPAGRNWYDWIKERLVESNMLLLLFTETDKEWDWCLYEAGLFTRLEGEDFRRVICLLPPNIEPPKPLKHLQAVVTQPDKLAQFLVDLFGTTTLTGMEDPINTAFAHDPEEIDRATKDICGLFGPKKVVKHHYNRYVKIHVRDRRIIQNEKRIPDDAVVESNPRSLEIFGLSEGSWTWRDLENKAREQKDTRWLDQLHDAVFHTGKGEIVVKQVQATFQGLYGGHLYRPILYRGDDASDGSMVFHILFIKEVCGQMVEVPTPINIIQTILVVGTRFRYEVINKGLGLINKSDPGTTPEGICNQVREATWNIEKEAESRGTILMPETVAMVFDNVQDKNEIRSMFQSWIDIRRTLFEAIKNCDIQMIQQQLDLLLKLNNRFMDMGSRRHHELVLELMCGGVAQPSQQ